MYPGTFDYERAESVGEAIDLLEAHADAETELLAGGHSLLPAMKTGLSDPDVLVDLGEVAALHGTTIEDGTVSIGAMTTYADFLGSEGVTDRAPAFTDAVSQVGDRQVRNCGTVGGNLAHADPAADLPGAALAADATLVARGPDGEREIPVDDFFQGMYATALAADELLTRVEVPAAADAVGAYAKKPSPSSGYAMVGVAARVDFDGERVADARVGANGAMDHGVRLEAVEAELVGERLESATIADAAARATEGLETAMLMSDIQASTDFRARLLEVYTERALESVANPQATPAAAD